jgi:hypothetical protein
MLPVPTPVTDIVNMADWLELRALLAADRNASRSDLRRVLVQSGVIGDTSDPSTNFDDEVLASDAFAEIQDRAASCGAGYPFLTEEGLIQGHADISPFWPYIFCLLFSFRGANRAEPGRRPSSLFEEVAEAAAGSYVQGSSLKFGFPRRILPASFAPALDYVCAQLHEGQGARKRPSSRNAKDARLDIVAWRPFPDGRPAQLILFGQCAAGANWQSKLTELQPNVFTELYWKEAPAVHPIKAFFTPFRLKSETWYETSKHAGILFDRCRIAHHAFGALAPPGVIAWIHRQLRTISE